MDAYNHTAPRLPLPLLSGTSKLKRPEPAISIMSGIMSIGGLAWLMMMMMLLIRYIYIYKSCITHDEEWTVFPMV